jgi:hypothetical protein
MECRVASPLNGQIVPSDPFVEVLVRSNITTPGLATLQNVDAKHLVV